MKKRQKKFCKGCGKLLFPSRSDTIWCKEKCRFKIRVEDAKFETPNIPKSGTVGITYNRVYKMWEVKIKIDNKLKYIGAKKTLEEAKNYQKEILGC